MAETVIIEIWSLNKTVKLINSVLLLVKEVINL